MLRWLLQQRLGTSTWLYQLRWFAVIGQLITICGASVLTDFQLPFWLLLLLVAFTAGTNVAYGIWLRTDNAPRDKTDATSATDADTPSLESPLSVRHQFTATLLMLLDLGMLTAMLYLSGGVHNPFAFFYFVNLAVAGVTLRPRFAWLLAVLAVFGYLLLLRFYLPVAQLQTRTPSSENTLRLLGLFFAFATCSTVVTYFVTRISEQLSLQQRRLRDVERERSRARRLEGLTTLAAGAAHELATPLSTIDVITRELTHHLDEAEVSDTVRRDVQLIDQQ
ncbi:MAG: sensor histidine kinase, partial [Planctomycetota bacterium]